MSAKAWAWVVSFAVLGVIWLVGYITKDGRKW